MNKPLADKIRPKTLDDVVGQRHILGKGRILRNIIESGEIPSMIFYGPSGKDHRCQYCRRNFEQAALSAQRHKRVRFGHKGNRQRKRGIARD